MVWEILDKIYKYKLKMARKNQISNSGIANQSGLEIFATTTTFNGEYVNWGDAFALGSLLNNTTDYALTLGEEDPSFEALVNSPATNVNSWMRFHTPSSVYYNAVSAPTGGSGYYTFEGDASGLKTSHSGMYQKLELITGVEYQITVKTSASASGANTGILYANTYTPNQDTFILNSTASVSYPVGKDDNELLTSLFTAITGRDVLVIYFTGLSSSLAESKIISVSIKEKQDYLTPIYAEDKWGNDHKVLRRNLDNTEQL